MIKIKSRRQNTTKNDSNRWKGVLNHRNTKKKMKAAATATLATQTHTHIQKK